MPAAIKMVTGELYDAGIGTGEHIISPLMTMA